MKKYRKWLLLALAVVMVCTVCITAWAEYQARTPIDMQQHINLTDVYEHPENYPNTQIVVHKDINDYITALTQDENLSKETRDALIRDARATAENSTSYLTLRQTVKVTDTYSAYPYFYILLENSDSTSPYGILAVQNATLDTTHNGTSKQFNGDLYYNLETSTSLYWDLNGDFYNNTSPTTSSGRKIDIGENGSVTFSAATTASHYGYVQQSGKFMLL